MENEMTNEEFVAHIRGRVHMLYPNNFEDQYKLLTATLMANYIREQWDNDQYVDMLLTGRCPHFETVESCDAYFAGEYTTFVDDDEQFDKARMDEYLQELEDVI
jgi:hypothetical protein